MRGIVVFRPNAVTPSALFVGRLALHIGWAHVEHKQRMQQDDTDRRYET